MSSFSDPRLGPDYGNLSAEEKLDAVTKFLEERNQLLEKVARVQRNALDESQRRSEEAKKIKEPARDPSSGSRVFGAFETQTPFERGSISAPLFGRQESRRIHLFRQPADHKKS